MTVAVVVPLQTPDLWRLRAWDYVRDHYRTHEWPIIVGTAPDPIWSKGAAVADAVNRTTATRLVIADADSFIDHDRLTTAVESRHPWVMPQSQVRRLDRLATEKVYDGTPVSIHLALARREYASSPGGGIVVVDRDAYDTVAGIDPRFQGWGGEDVSFGWALETLVGPCERLAGPLWHLWHPKSTTRWPNGALALRRRYRMARDDPDAMRALIDERKSKRPRTPTP